MSSAKRPTSDGDARPIGRLLDLTCQRFGKLEVLAFAGRRRGVALWTCRCDCGQTSTASRHNLRSGVTRSCGCGMRCRRPRQTPSPEYLVWVRRVKQDTSFPDFEAFLDCVGQRPSALHGLWRSDESRPFAAGNCAWRLRRKRQGRVIEHDGQRLTIVEWAKRLGISPQALRKRLANHDDATALTRRRPRRRTP